MLPGGSNFNDFHENQLNKVQRYNMQLKKYW